MALKTYSQLIRLPTFTDRFNYLTLDGEVGGRTFGGHRPLNQDFYRSVEWKRVRDYVIVRDGCCDLAHPDYPIPGNPRVHHVNPILLDDILECSDLLLNPEYLVCVSFRTHNALHYGRLEECQRDYIPRTKNDTCPWR